MEFIGNAARKIRPVCEPGPVDASPHAGILAGDLHRCKFEESCRCRYRLAVAVLEVVDPVLARRSVTGLSLPLETLDIFASCRYTAAFALMRIHVSQCSANVPRVRLVVARSPPPDAGVCHMDLFIWEIDNACAVRLTFDRESH